MTQVVNVDSKQVARTYKLIQRICPGPVEGIFTLAATIHYIDSLHRKPEGSIEDLITNISNAFRQFEVTFNAPSPDDKLN